METPFLGTKQFGGVKSGFGVGTKIVDEVPQMKPILEAVRGQNVFNELRGEAVTSSAPQCCQAKLGICVHRRAFHKSFLRMEELANERVVQPWLPLLDECEFEAPKVGAAGEKRDWGPNEQVLMFAPVAKGQFRLDQAVIGELFILAGSTVLPIKYVMKCRPKI